jgi:hypothetical protein
MKTIRINTFETNSSSTHSITIGNKSNGKSKKHLPLVEEMVLYPKRVNQFRVYAGESSATVFDTVDKKAALAVYWLLADQFEKTDPEFQIALEYLRNKIGYVSIDLEEGSYYEYYPCDDEGDQAPFIVDGVFDQKLFEEFVTDVVLNDEREITDEDQAY